MDPIIVMIYIFLLVSLLGGCYLVWSGISAQSDTLWQKYMLRQKYKGLNPERNTQWDQDVREAKWRSVIAGCILIVMGLMFGWMAWSNGLY